MSILHMADSAGVPTPSSLHQAKHHGVGAWAGYLPSRYASVSWSPAECKAVLAVLGRFLPVFVAPYNADTLRNADPKRDAADAIESYRNLADPKAEHAATVCLDIEEPAWEASPTTVLAYTHEFAAALKAAGLAVSPYGSAPTCAALVQHVGVTSLFCAAWDYQAGKAPKSWPSSVAPPHLGNECEGRRAWQFAGNVKRSGRLVDLGVADDTYPFLTHEKAKPPTQPTKPPSRPPAKTRATVTVKVGGKSYSGTINEA
jgi:hypothetical protein